MNERIIFHIDMDAFFASVEIVKNPSLKGKPVIVGGLPNQRGVVSTCSYEARTFGVRSAMSLFEAKKRCPHGIFLEGSFALYREYSDKIMEIFLSLTPYVEIVGIDEAYVDVTAVAKQYGGPKPLGELLKVAVFKETQLTCSIGIAPNKLLAKIASGHNKPNGLTFIPFGQESEFLAPLPIGNLPGIGTKTQAILNSDGFKTVKDLQNCGMEILVQRYGTHGYHFHQASFGRDNRPVDWQEHTPKSVGAETTFDIDQNDFDVLMDALHEMVLKAYRRLRRYKMRARGISIKLRYSNFKTITRSHTFPSHINDEDYFFEAAEALFKKHYAGDQSLRLIGISLEKLTDTYWQPTLWDYEREKSRIQNSGSRIQNENKEFSS